MLANKPCVAAAFAPAPPPPPSLTPPPPPPPPPPSSTARMMTMAVPVALFLGSLLLTTAATAAPVDTLACGAVQTYNVFVQEDPSTSVFVVQALPGHGGFFGALVVIDQPITLTTDRNSTLLGRAKGLAAFSNDGLVGAPEILWSMIFDDPREGGFGKSSLSLRGSNNLGLKQRELAIVGGTGSFRMAEGFVFVQTYSRDPVTRFATGNFTLFVRQNPIFASYLGALQQE